MLNKNHKNFLYFIIFLIPIFAFYFTPNIFTPLKFRFIRILSVPIKILSIPLYEGKKILFYHRTFEEYKRLTKENNLLKARLIGAEEIIKENSRFERLLQFKRSLVYSSVTASVIGKNPSFWSSGIIIDKGSVDGIEPGMPVVDSIGVVGKITEVDQYKSKVILLTDPRFSVAAIVKDTRDMGLATGSLQGVCRMKYVNYNPQVKIGDAIITSKISSSFPENLLIGEIVDIVKDPNNSNIEYIIEPSVALSQIEEILVIKNN